MANLGTCGVEVGLLKKKPCGSAAVATCVNCEQPLCSQHALPETTDSGKRSGKFICKDCNAAAKEQAKSLAQVARAQEHKKKAEVEKSVIASINNPPPVKKPAMPPAGAAAQPATPAEPEKKDDLGSIEFTPTKKEGP